MQIFTHASNSKKNSKVSGDSMSEKRNIHDEKKIDQFIDRELTWRLLKYTRPYLALLTLCVLFLVLVTLADLARPYILKIAIDDYINVYDEPMYELTTDPQSDYAVLYNRHFYIRVRDTAPPSTDFNNVQLLKYDRQYFLTKGWYDPKQDYKVDLSSQTLSQNNTLYHITPLSFETYLLFRQNDMAKIMMLTWLLTSVLIGGSLFSFGQIYLLNLASQKIIFKIRNELYDHVQHLSLAFFDRTPVGRLVTRITNDMNNINEMFTAVLLNLFKDLFLIVGTVIVMFLLDYRLAIISLSTVPVVLIAAWFFRIKAREAQREVKLKLARINSKLSENINGMEVIQVLNQEQRFYNEFDDENRSYLDSSHKEVRVYGIFRPSMNLIYSLTVSLMIWYGGGQSAQGFLPFGTLFAFINYIQQFYRPIFDLSEKFNIMQSAMASAERIFMLMDEESTIDEADAPTLLGEMAGDIEFKNVSFAYDAKQNALNQVSFRINAGETIAIVGATGSGKTTITNLLTRFYDVQEGCICIDGIDIRKMSLNELRGHIRIVLQDVFLFSGTIAENIRLHQNKIPDEAMIEAAQYVNAHAFISRFDNGYDHTVTERGSTFSSGERQLISFARAILSKPSILILDEATSSVDSETELLIQDAIEKITQKQTTIIIAHRLSTIQHADRILVMHKGHLVEEGTHEELLKEEGIYYDLYRLQYKQR